MESRRFLVSIKRRLRVERALQEHNSLDVHQTDRGIDFRRHARGRVNQKKGVINVRESEEEPVSF